MNTNIDEVEQRANLVALNNFRQLTDHVGASRTTGFHGAKFALSANSETRAPAVSYVAGTFCGTTSKIRLSVRFKCMQMY